MLITLQYLWYTEQDFICHFITCPTSMNPKKIMIWIWKFAAWWYTSFLRFYLKQLKPGLGCAIIKLCCFQTTLSPLHQHLPIPPPMADIACEQPYGLPRASPRLWLWGEWKGNYCFKLKAWIAFGRVKKKTVVHGNCLKLKVRSDKLHSVGR